MYEAAARMYYAMDESNRESIDGPASLANTT
jgi:hypothetical protein